MPAASRKEVDGWERDSNVFNCYCCSAAFSLLKRRHHCRLCGKIICSACSQKESKQRVCIDCYHVPLPRSPLLSPPGAGVSTMLASSEITYNKIPNDGLFSSDTNAESFDVLGSLGSGAFGSVFRVRHKLDGKEYALKVMHKRGLEEEGLMEYAAVERAALQSLHAHPYIVQFYCAFQTSANLYLVLELSAGGSLEDMMMDNEVRGDRMSDEQVAHYGVQLALAIQHIHSKGYIHRDIALDNVLLTAEGDVRLTDFGIATPDVVPDGAVDTRDGRVGKRGYFAPELIRGKQYDRCVDWYSFGVCVLQMLCGYKNGCRAMDRLSAQQDPRREKRRRGVVLRLPYFVSDAGKDLVLRLLQKDPTRRLGSQGSEEVLAHPFFAEVDLEAMRKGVCPIPASVVAAQRLQQYEQQYREEVEPVTDLKGDVGAEMAGVNMEKPRPSDRHKMHQLLKEFHYVPAAGVSSSTLIRT